jgi:hypothetical protein
MKPNLVIQRSITIAAGISPGVSIDGACSELPLLVAGHHPVIDPVAPAYTGIWPAPQFITATLNPDAGYPGVKICKIVAGVMTAQEFTPSSCFMLGGLGIKRMTFGSSWENPVGGVVDLTNPIVRNLNNLRFLMSLGMFTSTNDYPAIPTAFGVSQDRIISPSLRAFNSLATFPNYAIAQSANIDFTNGPNIRAKSADSIITAPLPPDGSLANTLATYANWYSLITPAEQYLCFGGTHNLQLTIALDPAILENEQTALTDLYIIVPASLGKAAGLADGGDGLGAAPGLNNNPNAFGTWIIPVEYLKRFSAGYSNARLSGPQALAYLFNSSGLTCGIAQSSMVRASLGQQSVTDYAINPCNELLAANIGFF